MTDVATWMRVLVVVASAACSHASEGLPDSGADAGDATMDVAVSDVVDGGSPGCPAGSELTADRTSCPATLVTPPASFVDGAPAPGDVVSMDGLDEEAVPCLPVLVCTPSDAPSMLFSDDPESPSSDGVLYADTVAAGAYRIYVYHSNGGATVRKFPVVVLNQGTSDAHVTIIRAGLAAPGTSYVGIGKSVAAAWLASSLGQVVTVPAGQRVLLDGLLDQMHAAQNELVHAIYDLSVDATLKISVVSVTATEDAAMITSTLPLLPDDGVHTRGTFAGANVLLVATSALTASSLHHVRLGDGTTEPELAGKDATTGNPVTLGGNYGVLYELTASSSTAFAEALSARGGPWGGVSATTGAPPVLLPSSSEALSTTTDAVWLGSFASGTASTRLISAGGSNLAVDFIFAAGP